MPMTRVSMASSPAISQKQCLDRHIPDKQTLID